MPKIIFNGTLKRARHTCKCKSIIEFDENDIRERDFDADYVECPVCKRVIVVSDLQWSR